VGKADLLPSLNYLVKKVLAYVFSLPFLVLVRYRMQKYQLVREGDVRCYPINMSQHF